MRLLLIVWIVGFIVIKIVVQVKVVIGCFQTDGVGIQVFAFQRSEGRFEIPQGIAGRRGQAAGIVPTK